MRARTLRLPWPIARAGRGSRSLGCVVLNLNARNGADVLCVTQAVRMDHADEKQTLRRGVETLPQRSNDARSSVVSGGLKRQAVGDLPSKKASSCLSATLLCHKFHTLEWVTMFLFRSSLITIQPTPPKQQQVTDMIS